MTLSYDPQQKEAVLGQLKDFQRATVDRVEELFRSGQKRVLVADEAGLGKTMIAKGVIYSEASEAFSHPHPRPFRVVYLCSSLEIARQNLRKLAVSGEANGDSDSSQSHDVSDYRLSMLHLTLANVEPGTDNCIQLIPLTPATSFDVTDSPGKAQERAMMFHFLSETGLYSRSSLRNFLMAGCSRETWDYSKTVIERYLKDREKMDPNCFRFLLDNLNRPGDSCPEILKEVKVYLEEERKGLKGKEREKEDNAHISRLRTLFGQINADWLKPDLVILDEFQRFPTLLNPTSNDGHTDAAVLFSRFLKGPNSSSSKVLMLSATPYRLYSGPEDPDKDDSHYREFHKVMSTLIDDWNESLWEGYADSLWNLRSGDGEISSLDYALEQKKRAEEAMYQAVCRTERVSVLDWDSSDCLKERKLAIAPEEPLDQDIRVYLSAGELMKKIGKTQFNVDYLKSCPFILSFNGTSKDAYQEKKDLEAWFRKNPAQADLADRDLLWIDPKRISTYQALPVANSRFEKLKEYLFSDQSEGVHPELYLWVPPSLPYYEMQGCYQGDRGRFSKLLVFSSYVMVPNMIASLISYEEERRTVAALAQLEEKEPDYRTRCSTPRMRPYPWGLLYPSRTLAELYDPVACLKDHLSLAEIRTRIRSRLIPLLEELRCRQTGGSQAGSDLWYALAPMLLDGREWADRWVSALQNPPGSFNSDIDEDAEEDHDTGETESDAEHPGTAPAQAGSPSRSGLKLLADAAERLVRRLDRPLPGPMPDDLPDVLTDMVLGSPAVCICRTFLTLEGDPETENLQTGDCAALDCAAVLANVFFRYLNRPQAIAAVSLSTLNSQGKCRDSVPLWKNVLRYCRDGCFQAMFDEYFHLTKEEVCLRHADGTRPSPRTLCEEICSTMKQNLLLREAPYSPDTFDRFRSRIQAGGAAGDVGAQTLQIRTLYAVNFNQRQSEKDANRKENIQGAFNSPLWPFVIATTSIGQEGLDFHPYCRKVFHWNLPSDPVDLEQREGRVNRYKCLAVRQSAVCRYRDRISSTPDVWETLFNAAQEEKLWKHPGQSDLVPYWSLGSDQEVKIERIVPLYPLSRESYGYERLKDLLSLYRLTLGQASQEALIDFLKGKHLDSRKLRDLYLCLSPFFRNQEGR